MPAIINLAAVRRFTDDLNVRLHRCDNGEGMECNRLETRIKYYVQQCQELRIHINEWAGAVFTGQVEFDPEIENLLKYTTWHLLKGAKPLAALGRAKDGWCGELEGLSALHSYTAHFDYLLENWVSPRLAVSPAPRVKLPDAAKQQISERLAKLPALPSDWSPTDPEQLATFQKQRAK